MAEGTENTDSENTEDVKDGGTEGEEPKVFDPEYVHGLREEAKKWRIKAREEEVKNKQFEEKKKAEMTDLEKAKAEKAEAEKTLQERDAELAKLKFDLAIGKQATKYNFADLEVVGILVNAELAGQEATTEAINEALAKIAKEKPYLVKTAGNINVNPANKARNGADQLVSGDEAFAKMLKEGGKFRISSGELK